jgi:hypothetical protein
VTKKREQKAGKKSRAADRCDNSCAGRKLILSISTAPSQIMQDYEQLREILPPPQHMWHSKRQFLANLNFKKTVPRQPQYQKTAWLSK